MPTVRVTVPETSDQKRRTFQRSLAADLDAGNDILFVDASGNESEVGSLQVGSEGVVMHRGKGEAAIDAISPTYIAGGFHQIGSIAQIYATGTTTGIGVHVKAQ